ncbi:MAG: LysR family transcriptional regulator [Paracoccus sp. (in: a-proteobacteria)]|uniref:winged helix-turn-helix domain-containing protein n=1 Tax=Paracoccus sp. TaxID=267 RepID=UPI0039E2387C
MSDANPSDPRLSLRLHYAQGLTFGRGKADLLQAIAAEGSISAAGRHLGMSYRRAWALVEEMNRHFRLPLVESSRGGMRGGGAQLTDLGRQVLSDYRALEDLLRAAPQLAALGAALGDMPDRK